MKALEAFDNYYGLMKTFLFTKIIRDITIVPQNLTVTPVDSYQDLSVSSVFFVAFYVPFLASCGRQPKKLDFVTTYFRFISLIFEYI